MNGPSISFSVPSWLRATGVLLSTATLLTLVCVAFWAQERQYATPAPGPADVPAVALGTPVRFAAGELPGMDAGKPVLLHFFNPACACSRFNLEHVRELVRRYRGSVRFVAVVSGDVAAFDRLGLGMPAIGDPAGRIAAAVGVYATPQAALLDGQGRLYYRGNYNASRYCRNPETEYARLALDALLAGLPAPLTGGENGAYGCPRPRSGEAL